LKNRSMIRLVSIFVSLILVCALLVLFLPGGIIQPGQTTPTVTIERDTLDLYGIDPYSLDPATIDGDATSLSYAIQIFSGLVRFDDNLEIVPDIAGDWQISDDGLVYTFYLRDDVFFQNGQAVTAEDFKYSWERACRPVTGSQTVATYLGDIVGADKVLAGEEEEISGIEVIGDYTLKVTIDEPRSYFLSKLTFVTAFVVNRNNVESGKDWWRYPDGSGPFKLKQWQQGSLLVLEKNDYYHPESSFSGVELVNYHLWAGRPMDLYETGQIDVAQVGQAYIDKITDPRGDFYQELTVFPQLNVTYVGFNCQKPPFDDANIRRAFSMAIDKDKLVSLSFEDSVVRADGILPVGMPGFNEDLSRIEYNVEKARELIAESEYGGVSNLPPITITTGGWGGQIETQLEAIINEWRINLGVEVEVRQLEPEKYIYELMQEKDEMFYWGWSADYPHPQNFLEVLFATGSEYNIGEYSNPEVDGLLQMAGQEQDSKASLELYRQVEQMLVDDAACIPLWYGKDYVLIKPYVSGYRLNPLGYAMLNEVAIVPE
jgi:oligopeptide transport system substrate-binding protein